MTIAEDIGHAGEGVWMLFVDSVVGTLYFDVTGACPAKA
jgi:hypothetical protein